MPGENPRFGRLITAMVTPFAEDGSLDLVRTEEFVARLIEGGNDALAVSATTGESPTLSHAEKVDLLKTVIAAASGDVSVIANVGCNCTSETIGLAREAQALGADGIMCVVPYYNKPPQEGLYQHFSAIAKAVDLPVILYNIPGRCSVNMDADTTLRLAHNHDNIVAIKEASGNMDQVASIAKDMPSGFDIYSGDDSATLEIMALGGSGVISTIGNVAPARMREIIDLAIEGAIDEASAANANLLPLMEGLFETTNPILVKEALALLGFSVGGVRLPLVNATPEQSKRLAALMEQVGVL